MWYLGVFSQNRTRFKYLVLFKFLCDFQQIYTKIPTGMNPQGLFSKPHQEPVTRTAAITSGGQNFLKTQDKTEPDHLSSTQAGRSSNL